MTTTAYPVLNAERLWQRTETLSAMTEPGIPWQRRAFTPLFVQSRRWLAEQFLAAGMTVSLDAGGNLVGHLAGKPGQPPRRPLIIGSHCDTVPAGGRYDGIAGVACGIEIAHSLHEQGILLDHPLEIIDFLSEEPSDYGISCIGSRAMAGALTAEMLQSRNPEGETLEAAIRRIGGDPAQLSVPLRQPGSTAAYIELHIEQGQILESGKLEAGVVTNIVGVRRVTITVDGQADHAGTTPMHVRRDALVGAARIIDQVNRRATALSGKPYYFVATVGYLTLQPNAANAVPATVSMTLEMRSEHNPLLESFAETLLADMETELAGLRLRARLTDLSRARPTDCDAVVMQTIADCATGLGFGHVRLPSGAGHDAMYMAMTGPMGMVFIPCLGGRSHCPEEFITPQQLLDGTRVMYQTLMALDKKMA